MPLPTSTLVVAKGAAAKALQCTQYLRAGGEPRLAVAKAYIFD